MVFLLRLPPPPPHAGLQTEKLLLPAADLEQWYQELMAGLGTGPGTGPVVASPRSSPPPLPAKASRQLQVTPPSLCQLLSFLGPSCQSVSHTGHLR